MPTYEYECGECGYRFERFQNMFCSRAAEPTKRTTGDAAARPARGAIAHDHAVGASSPATLPRVRSKRS